MILASIKPYYYYLIGERKKKIEVRKSALKNLPQNIVFYMSKDEKSFALIPQEFQEKYRKHFGKVGLKATCNGCGFMIPLGLRGFEESKETLNAICLTNEDLNAYGGLKTLYGWELSNTRIYGNPKELSEFIRPCSYAGLCFSCDRAKFTSKGDRICQAMISRPPQSYMFVEEVRNDN